MRRAIFAVFLMLALFASVAATGSQEDPNEPDGMGAAQKRGPVIEPSVPAAPTPQQQKQLNKQRYDKLKKDTDQLLKLATELKESVDKADQNTLSVDVIRKSEQIEKLAKSVKDKMKSY